MSVHKVKDFQKALLLGLGHHLVVMYLYALEHKETKLSP